MDLRSCREGDASKIAELLRGTSGTTVAALANHLHRSVRYVHSLVREDSNRFKVEHASSVGSRWVTLLRSA